jgi:hypothetical protein
MGFTNPDPEKDSKYAQSRDKIRFKGHLDTSGFMERKWLV